MLKLYTVKDLFSTLVPDHINVVGILKNVQHINVNFRDNKRAPDEAVSLNKLQNKYIGELHSTADENHLPIVLIEDGFSPLTSLLLSTDNHYIIVIQ
jgi:hypothetical protein